MASCSLLFQLSASATVSANTCGDTREDEKMTPVLHIDQG